MTIAPLAGRNRTLGLASATIAIAAALMLRTLAAATISTTALFGLLSAPKLALLAIRAGERLVHASVYVEKAPVLVALKTPQQGTVTLDHIHQVALRFQTHICRPST